MTTVYIVSTGNFDHEDYTVRSVCSTEQIARDTAKLFEDANEPEPFDLDAFVQTIPPEHAGQRPWAVRIILNTNYIADVSPAYAGQKEELKHIGISTLVVWAVDRGQAREMAYGRRAALAEEGM
jgi:hypothetical protein